MLLSDSYDSLERLIGYRFKRRNLLILSLRHRSGSSDVNFERLEFLGDRVLGLVIARWLYRTFSEEREGQLTRRFSRLVSKKALSEIASGLKLPIEMVGADPHHEKQSSVRADACEALLGAIYLDGGLNEADRVIKHLWSDRVTKLSEPDKDPRSQLQEWAQSLHLPLPEYREISRSAKQHDPEFVMRVIVEGQGEVEATGTSKRAASSAAAEKMLRKMEL